MKKLTNIISLHLKKLIWTLPFIFFLLGYLAMSHFFNLESLETPPVIGLPLQDALELLSQYNLNPRILAKKEEPDLPPGTVISQTPQPHAKIKANQSVFLVVATKPKPLKAPLLVNKQLNDIQHEVKKNDLRLKTYLLDTPHPKGLCIGQHPQADSILEEKKIIAYVCSGVSKPVLLPNFKGRAIPEILEFLNNYDLKPTIVHARHSDATHHCDQFCIISDQRPLAGTLITMDPLKPPVIQLQVR